MDLKLALLIALSIVLSSHAQTETEVNALVDFARTCSRAPSGWNLDAPETACGWPGVICNPNVKMLSLFNQQGLNCLFTESLGNLTDLTYLELSYSGLRGTIPESLSQIVNLDTLRITNSNLEGTIPSSLGNLTKLRYLDLQNAKLSGTLPPSLGNLVNLIRLSLNHNQLRGPLPENFSNLLKLQVLLLHENQLAGWIPQLWQNQLTGLSQFDVHRNKLYGCLQTPNFPPVGDCGVGDNNFCCVPSYCDSYEIVQQNCLGSPSSVMIWMSQYQYPPNKVFNATAMNYNNTYSLNGMIEGDTYLITSTLNCNDPDVIANGVRVRVVLTPTVSGWGNLIVTDELRFGDPNRWAMFVDSSGQYAAEGVVQCNPYIDTTYFTAAQQTYAVGVSVWQGSLVVGVLIQNDVAGAWASYATWPSSGGIVTSNDVQWNGALELQLSLAN